MGLFDRLKGLREIPGQMAALQEQAKTYTAAQGYGPDGRLLPPEQRPLLDAADFLPVASAFVKRTSCAHCGAPKMLPSVREYLYCDYCGQLVDFDLRQAMANAMVNPDATEHAMRANQLGPAAAKALDAGDREEYRTLQYQLYDLQTQFTRWAVPPRAWNDESYRKGWIAYSAELVVASAFDPDHARLDKDMRRLALSLRYKAFNPLKMATAAMGGGNPADATPKMVAESLWPLVDVLVEQAGRTQEVIVQSGIHEIDPDRMPAAVRKRMIPSSIAQAYLRFLEPEEGTELIARLGIDHEFVQPTPVGDQRACGGCGGTLVHIPGATCVVCDGCGRRVDVGSGEVPCTSCGATMCLPEGVAQHSCPYCRTIVRRS